MKLNIFEFGDCFFLQQRGSFACLWMHGHMFAHAFLQVSHKARLAVQSKLQQPKINQVGHGISCKEIRAAYNKRLESLSWTLVAFHKFTSTIKLKQAEGRKVAGIEVWAYKNLQPCLRGWV